ncbi:MacB family efflux pump subunit [Geomonas subterranea]|uniref:MacB family efflux pump subunit n=1 Tax=Geomonas subterranea TaxID=2847989 RepID=UPI001CD2C3A6|nr:MacB family efflux pump subunit [Geomonas fuzhouensis]
MSGPILEIKAVVRRFMTGDQELVVLKGVDLVIGEGEMVAIVGASGSGKSTLMNILGCLDRPSEGSYRIFGRDTAELSSDELARLRREHFGFIFQRYHLMMHQNAVQNVEIPAVYAGADKASRRARAHELLNRLGLSGRCDHRPGQLSGGQQQRVCIARALMNGGKVILADEPTGALDRKSGQELMAILHELNAMGHTVILVTHDQQVAQNARRIIEISDGEILSDSWSGSEGACPPVSPANQGDLGEGPSKEGSPNAGEGTATEGGNGKGRAKGGSNTWGRFAEAFKMAMIAMASHRMRTLLTMLGIVIGITSVVSVVGLGQGARQKVIDDISSMGTNVIDVYPGSDFGDEKSGSIETLVPADLAVVASQVYTDSATPVTSATLLVRLGSKSANASVKGVGEQYFRVRGLELADGSFFGAADVARQAQVVVIDPNTRQKFFGERENPIGKVLMVDSLPCQVIGVTKPKEGPFGNSQNLELWLPYTAAMGKILGQTHFDSLTVRVKDGLSNQVAEQSIVKLLSLRHGTKDFYTSSSDSIMKTVSKTTATMALMISAIAVISLVVGGIGVMNIMLVSVTERTFEIGIRMAVGARKSDIMQQFLIESVLVCLIGGGIGIVLSYGVSALFAVFVTSFALKFSALSVFSAVLCSTLVGVLFGYLPARNAARLDPIQALARE